MKKIVCVHLYNDFSGSPLILSTLIKGFLAKGYEIDLFSCGGREGFLSNLEVNYFSFPYRFFENKYIRLVVFMVSQMILFFKVLRYWRQDVTFYINTLLPFGAALAGKLMGKKVIYHIHETSMKPPAFKSFLKARANQSADTAIYVSQNLKDTEALPNVKGVVVYNGLSNDFIEKSKNYPRKNIDNQRFTVLMLCSLKAYKGVDEFVELAKRLPNYTFELVVNATEKEVNSYFSKIPDYPNLTIFTVQRNVHVFYQRADLVLNLSNPETWIETFGMTILEAMHYGIPCIVPPVGGPVELIENGINGYLVDQRKLEELEQKIVTIEENPVLYQEFSMACVKKASQFSMENMVSGVLKII